MDSSPDTLPSLAEASGVSTEADDVARALFQTPEKDDETLDFILGRHGEDSYEPGSLGSSSTDETKDTLDTFEQLTLENIMNGFVGVDNPGGFTSACRNAMNIVPVGLVDLFTEAGRRDSVAMESPAVTEVMGNSRSDGQTWKRKAESLERECTTLKQIIKEDSKQILRLKTEMEQRRAYHLQRQSDNSLDRTLVRDLEEECSNLRSREVKLLESIEKLKFDANNTNSEREKETNESTREIQRLKLENELFSCQIIEIERENQELLEENARLRDDFEDVSVKRSQHDDHRVILPYKESPAPSPLKAQVAALVAKLSEIEDDMEYREQQRNLKIELEEKSFMCNNEDDTLPFVYSASDISSVCSSVLSGVPQFLQNALPVGITTQDEFEVTLDGLIISTSCSGENETRKESAPQPQKQQIKKDRRSTWCDCFDPARVDTES